MKVISSYKVKMLDYNHIFDDTVAIYRKAVAFFLDVCKQEWTDISVLSGKERNNYVEHLTLQTKKNPNTVQKNPKLKKCGKCWYLVFPFAKTAAFEDAAIEDRTICAVDLGINQNAVCSIM
ncbi:MAG: hypothetical protein Q4F21_05515 [Lachnospiraceae bacterium]|nr:hypothetical protein [Lachnospiraceae bacterium]